jgi:FKBP-type peptidyl-prolyl cis-trans isomerase (trigger factor)
MKVSLNIENDKELRDYIKDLIKGQVISIARQEIRGIIKEVFSEKHIGSLPESSEQLVREEIRKNVREQLGNSSYNSPSEVKKICREEVQKILNENMKSFVL